MNNNNTLISEIRAAASQSALSEIIDGEYDLPADQTWGETASQWEAEDDPDMDAVRVLRAAERRWFELT